MAAVGLHSTPSSHKMWSWILTLLCFSRFITAFNVDTNVPIVKVGRRGSYFGFSVAQHQIDNALGGSPSFAIVVGAPKDNITLASARPAERSIVRPGQVYTCPISSLDNDCTAINLMTSGDKNSNSTDQWLGVSVASQATTGGVAVACAHRFKTVTPSVAVLGRGLCYRLTNSLDMDDFLEPCMGFIDDSEQQYGNCLAGTSVAVSKGGEILVGTPRAWAGRGGVFKDKLQPELGEETEWKRNPIAKKKTEPDPTCLIDSYLGMSVKLGNFFHKTKATYVGGAPRSREDGEVIFFRDDADEKYLQTAEKFRLRGDRFGSGYGYSVEVVDLNGDGSDDLVVGAPYYYDPQIGGAIYVYINAGGPEGINSATKPIMITSRKMTRNDCKLLNCENAQFGISLANIGDIDRDGFHDIAVGAPYEGAGCVYVFRGNVNGINTEYSQRICGDDIPTARPLTTFGYSLAGGSDVDKNGLPDIAVGAYESNKMLILRSRPVITIQVLMQPQPSKINPKEQQCRIDGHSDNCFKVRCCFKYIMEPKIRSRGDQTVYINYRLEAETFTGKAISRVYFKAKRGKTDRHIYEGTKRLTRADVDHECDDKVVYLMGQNSDFLNPIQFQLTYTLDRVDTPVMRPGEPLPDINNYPVINQADAQEVLSVEFEKDCGADETCHSNLNLAAYFEDLTWDNDEKAYILKVGQARELKLNVEVRNTGEDAHKTTLTLLLPDAESVTFIQASPTSVGCRPNEDGDEVLCSNIGNPLPREQSNNFVIRLDPDGISPATKYINLKLRVNTTSEETDTSDDFVMLTIKVVMETDVVVIGSSDPLEIFYGGDVRGESAIEYEDEIGGHVIHNYQVINDGRSRVPNATLFIQWPYEVENGYPQGKHLLYLMAQPEVQAPARCYVPPGRVNPLGVKVNPDLTFKKLETREQDKNKKKDTTYRYNERDYDDGTIVQTQNLRKRVKRENVIQPTYVDDEGRRVKAVVLDCEKKTAKCFTIRCEMGEMQADQSIAIKLRARLWNSTFLEDYRNVDHVQIYSTARLVIDPIFNVHQPTENDVARAMLKAIPDISSVEQPGVPIWVYILAGFAGLIVLIVIILILWKCGFFKRHTPSDMKKTRHYKKMKYKSPGNDEDFYS